MSSWERFQYGERKNRVRRGSNLWYRIHFGRCLTRRGSSLRIKMESQIIHCISWIREILPLCLLHQIRSIPDSSFRTSSSRLSSIASQRHRGNSEIYQLTHLSSRISLSFRLINQLSHFNLYRKHVERSKQRRDKYWRTLQSSSRKALLSIKRLHLERGNCLTFIIPKYLSLHLVKATNWQRRWEVKQRRVRDQLESSTQSMRETNQLK